MTDTQNFPSWNDLPNDVDEKAGTKALIGAPAVFIPGFILLFIVIPLITGCGSSGQIGEFVEQGVETVEAGEDAARSGKDLIEETGDAAEEAKETGQKFRGLRSKHLTLELAKSKSLDGIEVRVRPAGANQHKIIPSGDFVRYSLKASRFANSANYSIYTELNGIGRALKVSKEYFTNQQDGPAEILVLTETRENEFAWLPPSERDGDETIRFNGN